MKTTEVLNNAQLLSQAISDNLMLYPRDGGDTMQKYHVNSLRFAFLLSRLATGTDTNSDIQELRGLIREAARDYADDMNEMEEVA